MTIEIRDERPEDVQAIRGVTTAAFRLNSHASGTEAAIIDALRRADALKLSLVAVIDNKLVGHIAFSPVTIAGRHAGWFGLGPVSVKPDLHGQGIGSALINQGLLRLRQEEAKGCVVLGDPAFYRRFGFENDPALHYEDAPAEYFMALAFYDTKPSGKITFHEGFSAS